MRLGRYELGTPVEFGFTTEQQFYYPAQSGTPQTNTFNPYADFTAISAIVGIAGYLNPNNPNYVLDYPSRAATAENQAWRQNQWKIQNAGFDVLLTDTYVPCVLTFLYVLILIFSLCYSVFG